MAEKDRYEQSGDGSEVHGFQSIHKAGAWWTWTCRCGVQGIGCDDKEVAMDGWRAHAQRVRSCICDESDADIIYDNDCPQHGRSTLSRAPSPPTNLVALTHDDLQLIGDALGHLWITGPLRRPEIAEMAERTGLSVMVDG